MRNQLLALTLGGALALGVASSARAQYNAAQVQSSQAQTPANTQSLAQDQTAQPATPASGPMRIDPDRQLDHMIRTLGLSTDQQSQIKPMLVDRQQKIEAVFQDQSLSRQDRRAKIQSIRQDSRSRIEAVLNDQQKQKFEDLEQQRGRRGRGWGNGAPQPQS